MKHLEYIDKSLDKALNQAIDNLEIEKENLLYTKEEIRGGLFKGNNIKIKVYKIEDILDFCINYLQNLISNLGLEVKFEKKIRTNEIFIKMFSNNNSVLIGKNGEMLKSLQNILRQVIKKQSNLNIKVILDVENYKDKQKYYIEKLAKKVAKEVQKTNMAIELDNMNSYERRIVHNILSNFNGIKTESTGQEPNRHVVIKPNK